MVENFNNAPSTSEQLAYEAQVRFAVLGIKVEQPPKVLTEILNRAKEIGWTKVSPLYIPPMGAREFLALGMGPKVIDPQFWQYILNGDISDDSATTGPYWAVIDTSESDGYMQEKKGTQIYNQDAFSNTLKALRDNGRIQVPNNMLHVPRNSRFGLSPNEINSEFLPEFAKSIEVDEALVGIPTALESALITNCLAISSGPKLAEWTSDEVTLNRSMYSGTSKDGNNSIDLAHKDARFDTIAFRALIRLIRGGVK